MALQIRSEGLSRVAAAIARSHLKPSLSEGQVARGDRLDLTSTSTYGRLVGRFRSGTWTAADNVLTRPVAAPGPGAIGRLPARGSAEWQQLDAAGKKALASGEVGLVILSGGMATRFGWDKPKGLFPVLEGTSFLGWKLRMAKASGGDRVPIYIMTSFHTHDAVAAHLAEHDYFGLDPAQIHLFRQDRFRRLTPGGKPFHSGDGGEDFAATGHGDLPSALRSSGLLAGFLKDGGKTLLVSNVDNLGASPEPALIGYHLGSGNAMTAEVAAKAPGDKGGIPAMVEGHLQLVEGFALPGSFEQDSVPVFNTANYLFQAKALDRPFELPWYVVEKQADGQPVVQFEHLAGDLSAQLRHPDGKSAFGAVEVPRDERFIPVKGQGDLPHARQLIADKIARLEGLPQASGGLYPSRLVDRRYSAQRRAPG